MVPSTVSRTGGVLTLGFPVPALAHRACSSIGAGCTPLPIRRECAGFALKLLQPCDVVVARLRSAAAAMADALSHELVPVHPTTVAMPTGYARSLGDDDIARRIRDAFRERAGEDFGDDT